MGGAYHQYRGQFFCPSPFLSALCLEPPGALQHNHNWLSTNIASISYFLLFVIHLSGPETVDFLTCMALIQRLSALSMNCRDVKC